MYWYEKGPTNEQKKAEYDRKCEEASEMSKKSGNNVAPNRVRNN